LVGVKDRSGFRRVPYTTVLQEYSIREDESNAPTQRVTFALRSDGSRLIETVDNDGASGSSERILEFANGERAYLMDSSRTKSTTYDPEQIRPDTWLLDPSHDCLSVKERPNEMVLGEESISGYRAVRVAEGPVTRWLALDYGCAPVKEHADWGGGDASEKRLIALIPGEPSGTLFEVPSEFKEITFSMMFRAPNSATQDGYYYSHRPPQNQGIRSDGIR